MGTVPGALGRRAVPQTTLTLSALTFGLDPPAFSSRVADRALIELLRRARAGGITAFDLSDARDPAHAERLLAIAFPLADPNLVITVGYSSDRLSEGRAGPRAAGARSEDDLSARITTALEESCRRMTPQIPRIIDWQPEEPEATATERQTAALEQMRTDGRIATWSIRCRPRDPVLPPEPGRDGPDLLSGELSLLEARKVPLLERRATRSTFRFFPRDPFAGGRLDGTRFSAALADRSAASGPVDLRSLQAEFDPVLKLGFLTEGRRRTLTQASLQFLLRFPWVASVVVPLPRPERLDEILRVEAVPPLSTAELERLIPDR